MQKCRAIRDLETDLRELLRQDREGYRRGSQTRAARRVLNDDLTALAVLLEMLGERDEGMALPNVRSLLADSRG